MTTFANIDQAAHSGANGINRLPEATLKQRIAGNYLKGRCTLYGLSIAIESPRGTLRHWQAEDGTSGTNLMKFHYGYLCGTLGNDGDELDCSIGPAPEATRAYVINQFIKGRFDETKIMLAFPDERTARAGYLSNYTSGWPGLESCVPCSIPQLKWWIANGNMARPLTQDQLPHDDETDTMDKVIWDQAGHPFRTTISRVLYNLRAHDGDKGLIFDSLVMADILADSDGVVILDALVIPFARLEQRMGLLRKVLDRAGDVIQVAAMQVSSPFTQRGTTNVAVVFELTDGQTLSIFFHNPDTTPKKIMPTDELISWKWMLNKKDITVAVAPERGQDLNALTVATRIMRIAGANSARFIAANSSRAAKLQTIEDLKAALTAKEFELHGLLGQIELLEIEQENVPPTATPGAVEAVPVVEPVAGIAAPEPVIEPIAEVAPVIESVGAVAPLDAPAVEPAPVAPDFVLTAESPDEARARLVAAEQAASDRAAADAAQARAAREAQIKRDIDARQVSSAENFQLGQSAEQGLSGQGSVFDVPQAAPVEIVTPPEIEIEVAGFVSSLVSRIEQGATTKDIENEARFSTATVSDYKIEGKLSENEMLRLQASIQNAKQGALKNDAMEADSTAYLNDLINGIGLADTSIPIRMNEIYAYIRRAGNKPDLQALFDAATAKYRDYTASTASAKLDA